MSSMRFSVGFITSVLLGMSTANAALQILAESSVAPAGGEVHDVFQPTFTGGSVSNADLLEGLLPSATTGGFTQELAPGVVALTDGSDFTVYPLDGTGGDAIDHAPYATAGDAESVTYALGNLYDLQEIVVYGGWNDGGRDAQSYDVFTSGDGGVTFDLLGNYNNGDGEAGTVPIGWRVEFSDDLGGDIATNITHLKLEFGSVENGYTGYSEIDVIGVAVKVPGDANGDGFVNLTDFDIISDHFLSVPSAVGMDGDLDASNFVDAADFRLWKDLAPASVLALLERRQVPEPTSSVMALVGTALLVGRRAFRRRG